ncbi:MAG: ATP-binding protein [Chloroflexota bacterium]
MQSVSAKVSLTIIGIQSLMITLIVAIFFLLDLSIAQALENPFQFITILVIQAIAILAASYFVIRFALEHTVFRQLSVTGNTLQTVIAGDFSARIMNTDNDEVGKLQRQVNETIAHFETLVKSLEQSLANRARDLQTSVDVSRQITTILDQQELLEHLAQQTAEAFDLYHVRVYIYDEERDALDMVAASAHEQNAPDTQLKTYNLQGGGFSLDSPVPTAARTHKQAVISDVYETSEYIPDPYLPHTMAEAALPILFRGELLGVINLQSTQTYRFNQSDLQLLESFADQIAISIRNARLFEEIVTARQQAEYADNAKSAFLASTSHELRTPLNAIISLSSLVRRGALGAINEKQQEMLTIVWQSSQHLLALINDVLDMSKIESGSLKLFHQPNVELSTVIKEAYDLSLPLIGQKPVELKVTVQRNLPLMTIDQQRVRQILLNLLSNAIKFTEKGRVHLTATNRNDGILISVSDTGVGIAADDVPMVFEKFYQTESGLRQGEGTGLGLSITRSLVEQHGGLIWLESELNAGTTFYVLLPITPEKAIESIPILTPSTST